MAESTLELPAATPLAAHTKKRKNTTTAMKPAEEPIMRAAIRGRHPGIHVADTAAIHITDH